MEALSECALVLENNRECTEQPRSLTSHMFAPRGQRARAGDQGHPC